jgi:hypothetical protein
MTLQSSGAISLNEIHVEVGGTSGTTASINDADIRLLAGKSSGAQMSFNEWYGLTYVPPSYGKTGVTPQTYSLLASNYIMYRNTVYTSYPPGGSGGVNWSYADSPAFLDSTGSTKRILQVNYFSGYKGPSGLNVHFFGHNHTDNWALTIFGMTIYPNQTFTYGGVTFVLPQNHAVSGSIHGQTHKNNSTLTGGSGFNPVNVTTYGWRHGGQNQSQTNYPNILPTGSNQSWSVT